MENVQKVGPAQAAVAIIYLPRGPRGCIPFSPPLHLFYIVFLNPDLSLTCQERPLRTINKDSWRVCVCGNSSSSKLLPGRLTCAYPLNKY